MPDDLNPPTEPPPGWAAPGGPPATPPGWGPPPGTGGGDPYGQPGQAPYGQPGQAPYGQPGQPSYGQPDYGQPGATPYGQAGGPYAAGGWGYGYVAPQNDKGATTALVLGLVGLLCCGVAGGFAIYEGVKSRRRIAAANGLLTGDGMALAGIILGAIALAWMVVALILFLVVIPTTSSSGSS